MTRIEELYQDSNFFYAVLNGCDMLDDIDNGKNDDDLYEVCEGQFVFKEILDRMNLELDGIDCENYNELKDSGLNCFAIITRKKVYSWDSDMEDEYDWLIEDFNSDYETELESLEEIFNYVLSEEGLSYSLNIVSEGEVF